MEKKKQCIKYLKCKDIKSKLEVRKEILFFFKKRKT